jgi:uncharacterized protein Usg
MRNLFFKKISDTEFTIGGTIDIMERKIKSVEVDGETYTKTEIIYKTIDVSELEKYNWHKYDIEFDFFNIKYVFNEYQGFFFQSLSQKYSKNCVSSNECVARYEILFNEGVLDKRIIKIYTSKENVTPIYLDKYFDGVSIDILLFDYGFNNKLYCTIKLIDFFLIKDKTILLNYINYKNYFMEYFKIDIDEDLNVKTAIKLIKKLIKNKTN